MPIGPAAKGIIIVGGVIIAAGIAVYENPQVRDWLDSNRRKASEALNDFLDNLDPQRRRRAHAHGAHSEGDPGRTLGGGARREAPPNEEFALERRRLGEEYLEQRKQRMHEYRDKRRRDSLEPATQAARSTAGQETTGRATATAVDVKADHEGLRQRPKGDDEASTSMPERTQDDSNLDMSNTHIQISFSGAEWVPEPSAKLNNSLSQDQDQSQLGSSAAAQIQPPREEGPATPHLSAQAPLHPEPEFTTPVLSLDLSQGDEAHELYQTAPGSERQQNPSLPHTPSTAGSEMFLSRALSEDNIDVDMMSDAGTETASHISRTSSFGHIDEAEIGEQHMDVDDDVVSVASSWSAVSSRVSER